MNTVIDLYGDTIEITDLQKAIIQANSFRFLTHEDKA